jgi:predicted AAA+ superfamily ATPase
MLDKSVIQEIIDTWLADIDKKEIIPREEYKLLEKYIGYKHAVVISGVRRVGKTYLMFQLIQKLLQKYPKNILYINFEDERFTDDAGQLDFIYKAFLEFKNTQGTLYFFFDEIQNIKGWEKWLARMYEKNIKFYVSGSNASLLSTEFSKSLTGRYKLIQIFPLSFLQYADYKNNKLLSASFYTVENAAKLKKLLSQYLRWGGFPEVVYEDKKDLLQDYFRDIITRDVIGKQNIRYKQALREIALILMTNVGRSHSLYSLNKIMQGKSINTIKNYLSYLEEAYLLFSVPYHSFSLKKQRANPFKIYAVDNGLRNAVSFRFSKDIGWLYENTVAIELIKRHNRENIFYWKKARKGEVDFVVREGTEVKQLIQVCFDYNDETKKRELKGLISGSKQLECNNLLLLAAEAEGQETIEGRKVAIIPLWRWLVDSFE